MKLYQYHINDTEFAKALVDSFLEIHKKPSVSSQKERVIEPDQRLQKNMDDSSIPSKSYVTVSYNLTNFPDAKPGNRYSLFRCFGEIYILKKYRNKVTLVTK